MNILISIIFASLVASIGKLGSFSVFYLSLLPMAIFTSYQDNTLIYSFVIGILLFKVWQKPNLSSLLFLLSAITITLLLIGPKHGLNTGLLNVINSQRGEHAPDSSAFFAKLIHNKTEFSHSVVANLDKLLSPVSIYASGFYHHLSPYFPLGYLLPWDLYLLFLFIRKKQEESFSVIDIKHLGVGLIILIGLVGFLYIDQALIFSLAMVYFLGIITSTSYENFSGRTLKKLALLNTAFLIVQISLSSYFRI